MIQFQAMQLSEREIRKLFYAFQVVDVDRSDRVILPELFAHIGLPFTIFNEKIFSIFEGNQSGEVTFKDFVLAVWNFCTLSAPIFGK